MRRFGSAGKAEAVHQAAIVVPARSALFAGRLLA
jgi:hypothetical protein